MLAHNPSQIVTQTILLILTQKEARMKETIITSAQIKVKVIDLCTNANERTERLKIAVNRFIKEGQRNEKKSI